jgi:hypothetical protein
MGLRMQPRNEKYSTLFSKAGPNVVESAAINKAGGSQSSPADDAASQGEEGFVDVVADLPAYA